MADKQFRGVRLPDQDARDRAAGARGVNLVVEASAGTGKTHLLVERVVSLASDGVPLDSMAVVTFTEAAAAELRSRIRHGIASMKRGERREDCLRRLPGTLIGTIHGFASRVLRDYFHLTGVDPAFTAGEQAIPGVELARLWDRYLTALPFETVTGCADLLIEMQGIPAIALELACMPWVVWPGSFLPAGAPVEVPWDRWLDECSELDELVRGADRTDRLAACLLAVLPPLCSLLRSRAGLRRMLPTLAEIRLTGGRRGWPSREGFERAKALAGRLRSEIPSALLTSQFGTLVWPFVEELRRLRASDRSNLTFDDLLHRCRDALAARPILREDVSSRFRSVLIDEFQDTSGIQVSLFREFLSSGGRTTPGRLTVVGDPKQSIYGWRNADIEVFKATASELAVEGARETIEVSMRSTANIVRFVNAFGTALFADVPQAESRYACGYAPLVARPGADEGGKVTVALVPETGDEDGRRMVEAAWLADRLGREMEMSPGSGGWAVLFRSMTGIETYLRALSARGLPWSLDAGRDFVKRPETADLRALLSVLLVPSDRAALLTVLRSPFFAVPDEEITAAIGEGLETYLDAPPAVPAHVGLACELLAALRATACAAPPAELLQAILYRTSFAASIASSGWETGRRIANLKYLYDWCISSGTASTADLLEALGEKGQGASRLEDPSTPPSDDGSITIGTIHGAKGLTYPNVVLVGTLRSTRRSGTVMKDEAAGRAAVSFHDGRGTPLMEELKESAGGLSDAESRRLAYVAVTRAARGLIVMAHQEESAARGFFAGVVRKACLAALSDCPGSTRSEVIEVLDYPRPAGFRERVEPGAGTGAVMPGLPLEIHTKEDLDTPALRLGSAVHSILEKIDLGNPAEWLERNMQGCILPPGVDPREAARLALALFGCRGLPADLSSSRVEREYPVLARGESGRPEEGFVDLLVDSGEMLFAIDYKTDAAGTEEEILSVVADYRQRQERYGRALSDALGRPVSVWLALLVPGEARKVGDFPAGPGRLPRP